MSYTHFSKAERLYLFVLLGRGCSLREIGSALKKNPSSVSREIKRNSVNGEYDLEKANHKAYVKRHMSKYQGMKVREHPELEAYIHEKMPLGWSPETIAGRWKLDHPNTISITNIGIYKYLYSQYGQSLCRYLRYKRYRRKKRVAVKSPRQLIPNRVWIDERPAVVNNRVRFGDFEGDTMGVPRYTKETIAAVIERKSRYILGKKIARIKFAMYAFQAMLKPLPVQTFTLDNGVENVRYQSLGVPTYFCHPYSSWEKGSVEYAFKLIREYIPKKANLTNYTEEEIAAVIDTLNNRPRKCLDYRTPKEVFEDQFLQANSYPQCCT